jgi:hypothetical protein
MKPTTYLIVMKNQFLSIALTLLLIPFTQQLWAQPLCSNPNGFIYGLTNVANIHRISTSNAAVNVQMNPAYGGNAPSYSNAMGYNNANGRFYYFKRNSFTSPQEFVSFDAGLNLISYLAPSPAGTSTIINVGCVTPNGLGYYCIDAYASLFYYNIITNTWRLITTNLIDQFGNNLTPIVNARIYGDAAFDGFGDLWFLPAGDTTYGLYKLRAPLPTTAVASISVTQVIPPTTPTPGLKSIGGIAFNTTGQIFVSTNGPDDKLYRLNNNRTFTLLGTFNRTGVGNDLTSCNFPFTILPVEWESFTADLNANNQVTLKWAVSQQSNNKGYHVEQSPDGVHWEPLTFISTNPNEDGAAKYSYLHNRPVNGKHYYRIKQVDIDNEVTYSQIRIVDIKNNIHVELSPNPASDHLIVRTESIITNEGSEAFLFDFSGKLIRNIRLRPGISTIDIRSLAKGSYCFRVKTATGEILNERFIKQ